MLCYRSGIDGAGVASPSNAGRQPQPRSSLCKTNSTPPAIRPHPGAQISDARSLAEILARYREPSHTRSIIEIALTFGPLAGLWALAGAAFYFGHWWLSLVLAVPAAAFLVRLFMVQHDCGHGAFFRHRLANDWVGRVIGVITLTPYDFWRRTHAAHHASLGSLERRGIGDIDTLTVNEYPALSFWGRLRYRAYRHPLVMFGFGPAYLFILQHRLPVGLMNGGWRPWRRTARSRRSRPR
jgi:omega-6 fatty acid desaturase (delta-12 desaturase)